eukprot:ANDGO_05647.mRNA.1 hypothetical protein
MATSRRHQEYVMSQRRQAEDTRNTLQSHLSSLQLAHESASQDDRVRKMRLSRALAAESASAAQLAAHEESQRLSQFEAERRERETLLAAALEAHKTEAMRRDALVHKIAADAPELRSLRARLDAALVEQEQARQIAVKRAATDAIKQEVIVDGAERKRMQAEYEADKQRRRDLEAEKKRMQAEALEAQLNQQQERALQAAMAEFAADKMAVDAVVARLAAEDAAEASRNADRRLMMRNAMADQQRERNEMRAGELARQRAEDEAVAAYLRAKAAQEAEEAAQKQARRDEMQRIQEAQSAHLAGLRAEEEEMQMLRTELQIAEAEEAARRAEIDRRERMARFKIEMQAAYAHAQRIKDERLRAEAAEEEKLRQQMLAKFADDDRIEQLNAQRRRQKQIEHKHQVEQLLEERRARLADERRREAEDEAARKREEQERAEIIQQERQRLLREYAQKLVGHLPPGVFLSEEDLSVLPDEARQQVLQDLAEKRHREREQEAYALSTTMRAKRTLERAGGSKLW